MMSTLGERIRSARRQAGLTQKQLAERIGMRAPNTISNWEQNTNRPDVTQLVAIARALGAGLDYLLDFYDETGGQRLTSNEKELLARYRAADRYGRELIETVAQLEHERCTAKQTESSFVELDARSRRIDVYNKVAAGRGAWLTDEAPVPATIRLDARSSKADYAVVVSGDSMEPDYMDGDLLLVQHTSALDPGELGIFVYDGLGYFKKLGHGELLSLNPAYDPIVPDGDVAIQGRVIGTAERVDQ